MSGEPAPEEHFGPYVVFERLGVGGMATVHRALEQSDDGTTRVVALKRLLPHLAEDASFIKSFVREAKLASILNHINVVQIYELGRVGTEYFISMEYIDGRDLRRILRHARKVTGSPPIAVTVGLLLQLCDALDYAHNKLDEDGRPLGLVHRDISPSNLIVTNAGHLKVIDFGIAKAQSSHLRTATGRVKGKLAYMAPEAVSGSKDLDARSDVWACGVILHELLTARPLFASKNEYQTLLKVQRGDILPPSTFNQACPAELDAIVFRALARDTADRFASAAEMRDELLAVKRKYALHTGFKDLASWVDWAFGLEPPGGFSGESSGVVSMNMSRVHSKTPRPPKDDEEDAAVEVVWGSGNNESEDGPVVLEEVPDVSDKVRAKRDTDDERFAEDDIPTPLPSHGTLPSIYGKPEIAVVPREPDPKLFGADPVATDRPAPRVTGPQVPMPARSKIPSAIIPMPRTTTGPQQPARTSSPSAPQAAVPRPGPSSSSPPANEPRARRGTAPGVSAPRGSDRMAASAAEPPQRDRDEIITAQNAPLDAPTILQHHSSSDADSHSDSLGDHNETNPMAKPIGLAPEELFGQDAAEVLAGVSAQMEAAATAAAMPQFKEEPTTTPTGKPITTAAVPVVRFSKGNTLPPPLDPAASYDPMRPLVTKPGLGTQPIQPARAVPSSSRPPTNAPVHVDVVAPKKPSKALIVILVGVLLAGGTAVAVVMGLSGGGAQTPVAQQAIEVSKSAAEAKPAPPPPPQNGRIKFELEPSDAEIKIEGVAAHAGSPWSTELPPGNHQIEIHRTGYKSWLTTMELSPNETTRLRIVLEPVTSAIDATLTVSTTPAGLDVFIDGVKHPDKSPIKTTLKVGPHKIVVKQNGVEVWQQNVNAEASSDYEFNPSFTDAKKRERAQRTPRPPTSSPGAATTPAKPTDKQAEEPLDNALDKAMEAKDKPAPKTPTPDKTSDPGSGSATPAPTGSATTTTGVSAPSAGTSTPTPAPPAPEPRATTPAPPRPPPASSLPP
jgi:serine/threonine protein kinase